MLASHLRTPGLELGEQCQADIVQRQGRGAVGAAAARHLAAAHRLRRQAQHQRHLAAQHQPRAGRHAQGAVLAFGPQVAQRDELAQHAAPLGFTHLRADPEGGELLVAALLHLVGDLAAQHVDEVAGAVAAAALLAEAVDAAQRLAGGLGGIPGGGGLEAVVAVAAAVGVVGGVAVRAGARGGLTRLAKVGQQAHATAVMGLCQRQQGLQLGALQALELLVGLALVDHAALVHHVGQAVGHPRVGGGAVAPGAPCLLVVALDVLGQVQVGDEAHIGLVDAHAEGDGRGHHQAVLAQEAVLVAAAHLGLQARVVRQCRNAFLGQPGGRLLHLSPALAVDDAGLALMLVAQEAQQLGARVVLLDDGVADVRAVEAGHEAACAGQRQPRHDVLPRVLVGGGGECHARHAGVALVQR